MGVEKYPQPNDPEKINDEVDLLKAIQVGNQLILEKSGVLSKARKLLPDHLTSVIDKNTVTKVTWTSLAADDKIFRIPALRFYAKPTSEFLEKLYGPTIIIAIGLQDVDAGGKLILNDGFSSDDVGSVNEMLDSLQNYKDSGELPHLNKHLTSITDPNRPGSDHPSFNF